jgi:hypothetical protein
VAILVRKSKDARNWFELLWAKAAARKRLRTEVIAAVELEFCYMTKIRKVGAVDIDRRVLSSRVTVDNDSAN